ncbi:unnamed protein product [Ixodes pacificus]
MAAGLVKSAIKFTKVFDESKGRFLLVLLVRSDDTRLISLKFFLTDGNDVWRTETSFEELCGSLSGRQDDNMKHLTKRIGSSRLEYFEESWTLFFSVPGKTSSLRFAADTSGPPSVARLELMISLADASEWTVQPEPDALPSLTLRKKKAHNVLTVDKEGMSLVNPRSKKIPKSRGIEFD